MFSPLMLRLMFGDATALPLLTSAFFPSFVGPRAASHSPRRHFELQQAVVADLGPNQNKLHERSMAEWADLLKDTTRRVVSVERDGELIAQAVVLLPQMAEDTDMLDMDLPDEPHRVATVCSVVTHPRFRCKALMLELLNKAQQIAWLNNRRHMLALITDDNIRSLSQFLRAGYQIVGCGFDPVDGSNAFFAHKSLSRLNLRHQFERAADQSIIIPPQPLDDMKAMFDEGYVGYRPHKDLDGQNTGGLVLAKL